jgi:hypothetical protein
VADKKIDPKNPAKQDAKKADDKAAERKTSAKRYRKTSVRAR